jgi:hypothetical protein
MAMTDSLHTVLAAAGRAPEIPESADAYGFLVGSWELQVFNYWGVDVSARGIKGEVHAAWVLEGRAVQDVWIMPQRSARTGKLEKSMNMCGTTLRAWDASIQAWRIRWLNPAGDHFAEQIGRKAGEDVVQLGTRSDGAAVRWRFTEIKPNSFHWIGEWLEPDGQTWNIGGEFRATRTR